MSWPMVKLIDICETTQGVQITKQNTESEPYDGGYRYLYIADFLRDTKLSFVEDLFDHKKVTENDLVMANTGSPGRVFKGKKGILSNNLFKISFDPLKIDRDYFYYVLSSEQFQYILQKQMKGGIQKHLGHQTISKQEIPLPPLETQKQIAAVLEKADQLRKDCKLMEQELNSLAQSVFIDMFGDPVTNPKGWDTTCLTNHGSFKNGMNFSKDDSGIRLRYLGVGDFKSLSTIDDMNSLGWVDLNKSPATDYLLQSGDLVFVRSNGNKALVGRCISVYPKDEPLTYSGFCIRYRVEDDLIEPEYLNYLFRTTSMKQAMLEGGQGANIQNINQKILSSLSILLPPKDMQIAFCTAIESYRNEVLRLSEYSAELESLFQSLMQNAFKGELN